MKHKVYVSFKTEDIAYKAAIQNSSSIDMIDKSLNVAINSNDEDKIMQSIRDDYLSDSTVTILLIGNYGAQIRGNVEQAFIKRELQASLYHGKGNTKNGILGVVLPGMTDSIYRGSIKCSNCGGTHNMVDISDQTTISEFSYNFYIPNGKCAWTEEDRYCVLAKWNDFCLDPNSYIEAAFNKRSSPIADQTKVRP